MKRLCFILILVCFSCQEVVDVDVPDSEPRLVIEANIDWEKGTLGNNQTILLSSSTPYFSENTNVPVTGASVKVVNLNTGQEFVFLDANDGSYITDSFEPIIDHTYELEIIYSGDVYKGEETLRAVPDINEITQSVENGFDDEALEINIFFDDPPNEENYYFTKFETSYDLMPFYFPLEDEFTNGNTMTMFYEQEEDKLEPDDVVDIFLYSISERYYNYTSLLLDQADSDNPFSTTPVTLVGNCVNTTTSDLKPFGYFRLTQFVEAQYIVE